MKYSNKSGVKFRYYQNITKENKWKRRETQKSPSRIIMVEKNIQSLDKKSKLDAIQSNMGQAGADIGGHAPRPPKKKDFWKILPILVKK